MNVTRFAPSPTGLLHLGHAFAAITAREAGERFLLRIEDIDTARCREEFVEAIFEDLHWLGVPAASFPSAVLVLEDGAALLGYAMFGPRKDEPVGFSGQLYELYVRPIVLGTGVGHALFVAATDRLRRDSHDGFHLWVFEDNRRARRFYERHGGQLLANSRKRFDVAGHPVWEIAYGFRLADTLK